MVGYLASSAISLLNFFSTAEGVKSYMIWGMGSFGNVSMGEVRWFVPIAMLGLLSALLLIKPLNAMLLGEQYAENLGNRLGGKRVHALRPNQKHAKIMNAIVIALAVLVVIVLVLMLIKH